MRHLALLLLTPWIASAETVKVGFDDIARLVNERNQHITAGRLSLESSQEMTGHLLRSYLPTLDAHLGAESFRTGTFAPTSQAFGAVEARWNLFRGGRDSLEESVRRAQVQSSQAQFQRTQLEEVTKARRAYWHLVYGREMVALLKEAIELNAQNLASANQRIRAGIATETDRLEFEMFRVQLEQDLARARLEAANSQRTLSVLLGYPESTEVQADARIPHTHDDTLMDDRLDPRTHRDVVAAQAESDVSSSQSSQSYRWWTPSLDLYGGYALFTLRERDYLSASERSEPYAGVQLTFNIFDGLQSRASGASLSARAEALDNQARQTARELAAEYEGSKQALGLTHDLVHSSEKGANLGVEYLSRTQAEYKRGVKNSVDVLSATQKYVELKQRFTEVRRDYQLAKAELLSMLGK